MKLFIGFTSNTDMAQFFVRKVKYSCLREYVKITSGEVIDAQVKHEIDLFERLVENGRNDFKLLKIRDIINIVRYIFKHREKIETVIFDNEHFYNLIVCILLKRRVKVISTLHDVSPHFGPARFISLVYNFLIRKIFSDSFLVFNKWSAERLGGSRSKIYKLGFESQGHRKHKQNIGHFLWFGRALPYKGCKNLNSIWLKFNENFQAGTKLVVAGAGVGDVLSTIQHRCDVDIIDKFIEEEELNSLIADASAILLPYNSATQSGVMLKSFSLGRPVIAYNVGALGEYLVDGKNGKLVKLHDVNSFAEAMHEILCNQDKYDFGTANYYSENFNLRELERSFEQAIRGV